MTSCPQGERGSRQWLEVAARSGGRHDEHPTHGLTIACGAICLAAGGLSVAAIGTLAAIYPGVWSLGQLATNALSDRIGRKWMIGGGMWVHALAIGVVAIASSFGSWALGSAVLGVGTAMVYPTLIAAIGDVAHPSWRASAVGVYRLWRDDGYAVGALLAGVLADLFGSSTAVWAIAALTAGSGLLVAARMYETHRPRIRARSI